MLVVAAGLLLAACGGGDDSASPSTTTSGSASGSEGSTTVTTSGGASGSCYTKPGSQHAKVRFVNLFTNATYPSSDIAVRQGYGAKDPCGKELAKLPFGSASDYIDVAASDESGNWNVTGFVGDARTDDNKIITQSETWKGGERVTVVFEGAEAGSGLPPSSGGDQTFFETEGSDGTESFSAVSGKAALGIAASAVQYSDKDGAWVAGVSGTSGCLKAAGDTDSTRTNIGGTTLAQYPVAPGSITLSLYNSDPGTCSGTAAIGPATINAAAGSRTFVFVYGPDAQHLKLLVLPVSD